MYTHVAGLLLTRGRRRLGESIGGRVVAEGGRRWQVRGVVLVQSTVFSPAAGGLSHIPQFHVLTSVLHYLPDSHMH